MSIIFTHPIQQDRLRMAFNNDVIRFYSTSALVPKSCTISNGNNAMPFAVTLYPDPENRFFFNFRPYVSALINTRNFEDALQTELDPANPDSFVYNASEGMLLQMNVTITITFTDDSADAATHTLTWLAGVQQLTNHVPLSTTNTYVLAPFKKGTANRYYLKYWQGYPFDASIYSFIKPFSVLNETNLLSQVFNPLGLVFRMVFSNGDDDETLEDVLPLVEGYNTLRLMAQTTATEDDKFISLEKVPYKCGVYLKWLNAMGGYSYWLFEDTYSIDRSTKQLGELDRDNANPEHTFARTTQVGKESQDTLKIVAELLTEDERSIVEGLLDSPKIYLFTGKPFAQNDYRNWVEVSLKTTSSRLKNPRQPLTNFTFDIELPVRYAQTL